MSGSGMGIPPESAIGLGIKLGTLVAGFAGSVLSLSFIRNLTGKQAIIAVATGVVAAHYLTPGFVYYFSVPDFLSNPVAFIIGLTAMNIIPGILKLSECFKRDPFGFAQRVVDLLQKFLPKKEKEK